MMFQDVQRANGNGDHEHFVRPTGMPAGLDTALPVHVLQHSEWGSLSDINLNVGTSHYTKFIPLWNMKTTHS